MSEIMIKIGDIEICAESFGSPDDPCILLIMGATASMIWWDEEFCQGLAGMGRFVIRYDNRDVGCSTCYEPGNPQYSVLDMSDDSLSVLDAYNIEKAHFVGMSLGGMISQIVAIRNPERVLSLTLISSSVWDVLPELPPISQKVIDYHSAAATLDWTDREAVIKYMVGGWRLLNGSKNEFDENRTYKLAELEANRAKNLLSKFNHALLKGGEELYGKSKDIKIPTLIIHGTEDIVLPFEHGEALLRTIPNSLLLALEETGHEIHYEEWDEIISAIINHTGKKDWEVYGGWE